MIDEFLSEVKNVQSIELPGDVLCALDTISIHDLVNAIEGILVPAYIVMTLRNVLSSLFRITRFVDDENMMYTMVKQYLVQIYRQLWLRDDFNSKLYYLNWENTFTEFTL